MSDESQFTRILKSMQIYIHDLAKEKGFWRGDRDVKELEPEKIALMHSELSEVLEAIRHGNPPSEKIPGFSQAEEEYADLIIRVLDIAEARGYRLAGAIFAKIKFNTTRPHKHGKVF